MFHSGQKAEARKILNAQHNKIRTIDAVIMSFFIGAILVQIIFFAFFLIYP
jgi:hypothetical protein